MPSTFKTFERLEPVVEITNTSFILSKVILKVEENGVEVQANVPARDLPEVRSKVTVKLDLAMVFVFPVRYR